MRAAARLPGPGRRTVPHARPCLGRDEEEAALRVLRSARLAPGAEAARLEALVARLAGAADAVALSSGTMALTLALRGLGVGAGQPVAIPSYACAALLQAVRAAGAVPLICDIDPASLALDPADLDRRSAGRRTAAVIMVHPFGVPAPLDPFRGKGLLIIEDCAQAPGALEAGRPVGSRGDAAVFSFGPTKPITCGGPGGALASPRAALVRVARDLAAYDEKHDDRPRVNGLMGDLHAGIAAAQIGRLPEFAARRAVIAARYDEAFRDLPLARPACPAGARPIVQRYVVRARDARGLIAALQERGIQARRPIWMPLHQVAGAGGDFPATEAAHSQLLSLPMSPSFGDEEIDRVIEEVLACRAWL